MNLEKIELSIILRSLNSSIRRGDFFSERDKETLIDTATRIKTELALIRMEKE